MLPVVPIVCEISTCGPVNPTYDSLAFSTLMIMLLSSFSLHVVTIRILPVFTPNAYLQEKHAEHGPEDWKVYAHAVCEIVREKGNMVKETKTAQELKEYYDFCDGDRTEIECVGVKYTV